MDNIASGDLSSSISSAFQMLLALLFVIALAYLILHKGIGSLVKRSRAGDSIKIKESVSLGPKHALHLVEIRGHSMVLATSEKRVEVVLPSLQALENNSKENLKSTYAAIKKSIETGVQ